MGFILPHSEQRQTLTIVVQQAFSRMVPQQPKKATTNMMQPRIMMQMGMVRALNVSLNEPKVPMLSSMIEPTTMSNTPPTCKIENKIKKI